jgi:hypothetical protein
MNRFVNVKFFSYNSLALIIAIIIFALHALTVGQRYIFCQFRKETHVLTADKPFNSSIQKRYLKKIQQFIRKAESNNGSSLLYFLQSWIQKPYFSTSWCHFGQGYNSFHFSILAWKWIIACQIYILQIKLRRPHNNKQVLRVSKTLVTAKTWIAEKIMIILLFLLF